MGEMYFMPRLRQMSFMGFFLQLSPEGDDVVKVVAPEDEAVLVALEEEE